MARIRSLKPEVWMSAQVMNLSHPSRLLFIGLITQADDEGRGSADIRRLKAAIFGGDDVSSTDVRRWLDECQEQGLVRVYEVEKQGLLFALPSWTQHQSIDRPKKSNYPPPPKDDETQVDRRALDEPASTNRRGSEGRKDQGSEGSDRIPARAREIAGGSAASPQADHDRSADHAAFERLKAAYPSFTGRQDWLMAENACVVRIDRGEATWDEFAQSVGRYALYVAKGGVSGPQFVLTPAKFFGAPDSPWRNDWTPPPTKAETRLAGNLSAAEEFMRRTEVAP